MGVFCRSPFDGRPQGGGHLEPPARDSSGGCPGFIYPLGPGTFIRTDHLLCAAAVPSPGATDATAEVLTAVANSQAEGNLVRRLEISFIRREDRPATATRATPACETFNLSIRAARPMETQPEASVGAAQADRRQLVPPAPGATAFKRGRPVTLLHQTGQGKNTVAQIHAGGATPPRRSPSVGETATPVTERSWECLRLTPGRSLLLRLFVSSILRLSEDRSFFFLSCSVFAALAATPSIR